VSEIFDLGRSIGRFINLLVNPGGIDDQAAFPTDDALVTLGSASSAAPAQDSAHGSMAMRARDQLAALQRTDPNFSEVAFLAAAAAQYGAVLAAESALDARALAGIATDAFIACFQQKLDDWAAAGLRGVTRDIQLLGSTILNVSIDGSDQAILVRFVGTGVRATQDTATGAAVEGSLVSSSFTEFATFVRPAGTTTPPAAAQGGSLDCPSCGAPTVAGAARCPYCGSQLTGSGALWLISKLSASAYT
jgi:predicted lipid-binding transport protein (Tim44 family)